MMVFLISERLAVSFNKARVCAHAQLRLDLFVFMCAHCILVYNVLTLDCLSYFRCTTNDVQQLLFSYK